MMRNIFIVNPYAGSGIRQKNLIAELEAREIKTYVTSVAGEAQKIAEMEASKGDDVRIFACGGEGTNYEVINGIAGYKNAILGIVPCGTANDFIKFFESSPTFSDLECQLNGEIMSVDLIKVQADNNTYYGINSCSAGMDAMVCENTAKFKKIPKISGKNAYILGIVYTFFQKFGKRIDFKVDEKEYNGVPSLFAVCANAPFYGGGYMCAPSANPSDGVLNYSVISTRSRIKTVLMLGKYRKGTHINLPYCLWGSCKSMEYHCNAPTTFNIDGEIYKFKDVKCSIAEGAIKLSVPKAVAGKLKTPVLA